jgi:hypothetical protein
MVKAIKLSGIVVVLTLFLITLTACNDTPTSTSTFTPTSISWENPGSAVLLHDISLTSANDAITVHITRGTIALDSNSHSLGEIGVTTTNSYPAPDNYRHILAAFDFSPSGATFDPGIQTTLKYDPAAIPSGIKESQLVIAFYDEVAQEWQYISGTVNPYLHTITFTTRHFTIFTIQTPPIIPKPIGTWVIVVSACGAALLILGLSLGLYFRYRRYTYKASDEDAYVPAADEEDKF